ncbi:unnamed protein product [Parnassius apollo]|uniref:(apollo) hypothetical protein n=1 Tax=Parnassius apollo TaxID=110799 RepID=A0A8S3XT46_PARAO|nr:unnamed protein product [Parnassius apollo]
MIRSPNGNESKYNSQPDLSRRTEEESNVSIRKRKKMDHDCDCKAEIQGLRSEVSRMNNLLEKFVISQEKLMTDMRENIKTLNEEIKDIKSSTSGIVKDQDNIKGCITDLNSKFSTHEDRLTCLEGSLKTSTTTTIDSSEPNQLRKYEEIIQEIKERKKREKNIIIVGISEQTATSTEERVAKDEAEVLNITAVSLCSRFVLPDRRKPHEGWLRFCNPGAPARVPITDDVILDQLMNGNLSEIEDFDDDDLEFEPNTLFDQLACEKLFDGENPNEDEETSRQTSLLMCPPVVQPPSTSTPQPPASLMTQHPPPPRTQSPSTMQPGTMALSTSCNNASYIAEANEPEKCTSLSNKSHQESMHSRHSSPKFITNVKEKSQSPASVLQYTCSRCVNGIVGECTIIHSTARPFIPGVNEAADGHARKPFDALTDKDE